MKRTTKILKMVAAAVGILIAIALVVNAVLIRTSGARLESRLAQLRTDEQPTSLSQLATTPIAPDENAAVSLRRVRDHLQAVEKELRAAKVDSSLFVPNEVQAKAMRSAFDAFPQLIPALKDAANRPHYDSQLDYTLGFQEFLAQMLPQAHDKRAIYRVLNGHILLLAVEGKHDEALADCITILKLTRHFDREPAIVNYLVSLVSRSVAIDSANMVLQTGKVSGESRQSLEAALALHDNSEAYKHALRTERAMGLSAYQDLGPWSQNWLMQTYWNRERCHYLDLFSNEISAADKPYSQAPPIGFAESKSHPLAANLLGPLQAAREANAGVRAAARSLRVLNAIQGLPEEPQQATDLSKLGLSVEATTDPFIDRPLTVKKLAAGWLVYSVGKNLTDDGGEIAKHEDIGVGPEQP
jgi:hypothetical protein